MLDARGRDRYRGETEPVDRRAGHIPGARNAPWTANLDPATGRFLAAGDAARAVRGARRRPTATPVVAYCGSGVSACANLLALEAAGLTRRPAVRGLVVGLVGRPRPGPVATG